MRALGIATLPLLLAGCQNGGTTPATATSTTTASASTSTPVAASPGGVPFQSTEFARFDEPWAMSFLPDGKLLVSEKPGKLKLFDPSTKAIGDITGVPKVAYGGQGGLGDVVPHPAFARNGWVYFS